MNYNDSDMEDAGFTLEDVEDDEDVLVDFEESESEDMFSFDMSADDDEI